jgi:hypothetical protein
MPLFLTIYLLDAILSTRLVILCGCHEICTSWCAECDSLRLCIECADLYFICFYGFF